MDCRRIVLCEESCLQLADPVQALRLRQSWITRQLPFEPQLIEQRAVKRAKFRAQATKGSDESELRSDDVNNEADPGILREFEALLGFMLCLNERIPRSEKVRAQVSAAKSRKREIADSVRG